jgi:hypothetical protein
VPDTERPPPPPDEQVEASGLVSDQEPPDSAGSARTRS